MNILTFFEIVNGKKLIFKIEEQNFQENFESICFNFFRQADNQTKTFAFILNNNKVDFFSQALTDEDYINKLNSIVSNKLTLFWGEPDIEIDIKKENRISYIVQSNISKNLLWEKLKNSISESTDFNDLTFPLVLFVRIIKEKETYRVEDSFIQEINLSDISNINEFKNFMYEYVEHVVNNINVSSIGNPLFSNEFNEFLHKEFWKVIIKKGIDEAIDKGKDFLELLNDLMMTN